MNRTANRPSRCVRRKGAFSLAETAVSVFIVGVLVVAALNTVGAATVAQQAIGDRGKGELLAHDLMTEVLQQRYEEPDDTPTFGRESSESDGSREFYDDVDDYHAWNSSPPEYKDGTEIPDLSGWRRTVAVYWVDPSDLTNVIGADAGVKRINVTVTHNDKVMATIVAIRTADPPT